MKDIFIIVTKLEIESPLLHLTSKIKSYTSCFILFRNIIKIVKTINQTLF